jgi:small subunit ribosomal protein S20
LAHSPRGWSGARTPSAIKRVRQAERRHAINQPRRSAAKTLSGKALLVAVNGDAEEARESLARAISALDRAAKIGAIHPNAASRRKSRLTLKVNAALGGEALATGAKPTRTTGKTAAAKEARARIAAGKAAKAKGAQTAAGKARAALARTTREAGGPKPASETTTDTASKEAGTSTKSTGSTKARASRAAGSTTTRSRAAKPKADEAAEAKPRAKRASTKKSS